MRPLIVLFAIGLVVPSAHAEQATLFKRIGVRLMPTRVSTDREGLHVKTYRVDGKEVSLVRDRVQHADGVQVTREAQIEVRDGKRREITAETTMTPGDPSYRKMGAFKSRARAFLGSPMIRSAIAVSIPATFFAGYNALAGQPPTVVERVAVTSGLLFGGLPAATILASKARRLVTTYDPTSRYE